MATAAFGRLDFDEDILNGDVVDARGEVGGGEMLMRLSPFHMPQRVEVFVDGTQCVSLRFFYPNSEPPEPRGRPLEGFGGLSVVLGKITRKILELRYERVLDAAAHENFRFDDTHAATWLRDLPGHARFAAQRNAEVVRDIVDQMPDKLRAAILARAREMSGTAR